MKIYTKSPKWLKLPSLACSANMYDWLVDTGSFMQRLDQHHVKDVKISVQREGWLQPSNWEKELVTKDEQYWVREVSILNSKHNLLYARAVIAKNIIINKPELKSLNNKALGSILFKDGSFKRSELKFAYVLPKDLWDDFAKVQSLPLLWVRSSIFTMKTEKLLLTEIFLPSIESL